MPSRTTTDAILPQLVYGDWEWDDETDRPANVYPARIRGTWSGGVEFLTDRPTAERIVAAQAALRAQLAFPQDLAELAWEGETMVLTEVDGSVFRFGPDAEGLYDCGFGWTWGEWTDEDEQDHPAKNATEGDDDA